MVRTYALLAWTWTRAAAAYPASFTLMIVFGFAMAAVDVAVILVIFANTTSLAGFTRAEVLFLYGAANVAFSVVDMCVGNIDRISQHIKAGTFDAILIRPASAWVQTAVDRFTPTRIGRVLQAVAVLCVALAELQIPWQRIWMVPVMIATAMLIFASLWTLAGALQFALTDAPEIGSAFTYGSGQLSQYPFSVYGRDLVRGATYVLPLAFINWQPGLYVLGRDDPFGTPEFLRFLGPPAALLLALLAALAWRQGIRRYRSTGS
ncbi:ABC transporter permease [Nonomuraea africana]|uniref:ABC-2 type transport system permease protein n=1 Tax=Nonomuraea africana TaxID=46171 RepID=A0ABR9KA89_9ACTN|nr:ABC-2 family transporter protein [Nonomuraea africana]MBE1558938.1 ABC-2 type transport system permease protein [Nonomuraea africana]